MAILALISGTLIVVGNIYGKGKKSGEAGVSSVVQTEAIRQVDGARKQKENADGEVRRTPYDDRVDGLR